MSWIEKAIDELLISSPNELKSRIAEVISNTSISGTNAKAYIHCIQLDGNGNPRLEDFAEFVAHKIVEYAIPKNELDFAKDHLNSTGSPSKILELKLKAASLFTELEKSGEGGELILYLLTQEILKFPQLISKMSLKTSGNVHYHGVDGIHVKFDPVSEELFLYWGESKMYSDINTGLSKCFDSLKDYILDSISSTSKNERDLHLISSNVAANVNNEELEDLLVQYFDKDNELRNKIKYKGICFVGFDYEGYPNKPLQKDTNALINEVKTTFSKWVDNASTQIKKHVNLELYEIHVFLIPFPSVQKFRDHFIKTIKI